MARRTSNIAVWRPPQARAPAPVIHIRTPRAVSSGGHRKRRSHRRSSGRGAGSTKDMVWKVALGGAAFGLIEKLAPNLPTIPVVGRAGTVAIAAYFFGGKKPGLARDVCLAAASLAAYQLLKEGKIAGEDLSGIDD